jgi:hypothetical protein
LPVFVFPFILPKVFPFYQPALLTLVNNVPYFSYIGDTKKGRTISALPLLFENLTFAF